jgi:hypothetical protein
MSGLRGGLKRPEYPLRAVLGHSCTVEDRRCAGIVDAYVPTRPIARVNVSSPPSSSTSSAIVPRVTVRKRFVTLRLPPCVSSAAAPAAYLGANCAVSMPYSIYSVKQPADLLLQFSPC